MQTYQVPVQDFVAFLTTALGIKDDVARVLKNLRTASYINSDDIPTYGSGSRGGCASKGATARLVEAGAAAT